MLGVYHRTKPSRKRAATLSFILQHKDNDDSNNNIIPRMHFHLRSNITLDRSPSSPPSHKHTKKKNQTTRTGAKHHSPLRRAPTKSKPSLSRVIDGFEYRAAGVIEDVEQSKNQSTKPQQWCPSG